MRASELVALMAAHGVDFEYTAGNASETRKLAAKRRPSRDERIARIPVRDTVRGSDTRVYRKPSWSGAEIGDYCQGVPRMPWLAACHSFAGDSTGYVELHRGLMVQGLKIATRANWPMSIRKANGTRGFYQAELSALVLDADMHPSMFARAPKLHAWCMGCHDDLWDHVICHWYTDLKAEYDRWLSVARGMIQHWINEEAA